MKTIHAAIFVAALVASPALAPGFELEVPLRCEIGQSCFIQQYADHDAGPGVSDYTCGAETYDGHDGTDFRVHDIAADVDVLAAAGGTVRAMRDGVDDRLATTPDAMAAVKNVECGNGVVIAHAGGYETQYCHMRKGSIVVKAGQQISAGDVLGKVGYSGAAAFPHLHLAVRQSGRKIDPFSGSVAQDCKAAKSSRWSPAAQQALQYQSPSLMDLGWATGPVSSEAIEQHVLPDGSPLADWPALVGYVRVINLNKGDELRVVLAGPDGEMARNAAVMDRAKAQNILFAGKKAHAPWGAGKYELSVEVLRDGSAILKRTISADIK